MEGLGARFAASVEVAIRHIAENPLQFPAVHREVRRTLVRRFPYGLFYVIEPDRVTIIACFHASCEPRRWQGRV